MVMFLSFLFPIWLLFFFLPYLVFKNYLFYIGSSIYFL